MQRKNISKQVQVKTLLFICTLFLAVIPAQGQSDVQLSQQMFSRINYNPAATGSSVDLDFYALIRQQWIGFKLAPSTVVINGHTAVPWQQSGYGFSLIGDMLGAEKNINPKIRYAFHLPLARIRSSIAFGIGAGILYKTLNWDKIIYENPNEPLQTTGSRGKVSPDFDFGVEFNSSHLQVGTSITHLSNKWKVTKNSYVTPHLYLYARGMIDINSNWQFSPSVSWHKNLHINQYEVNATLFMKKRFWFGGSYRWQESIVFMAGAYVTPTVMVGYSYDYSTVMSQYQIGSHELMISVRIPQPNKARRLGRMRECFHQWW